MAGKSRSSDSDAHSKDSEVSGLSHGEFDFLNKWQLILNAKPEQMAQLTSRYTQLGYKYLFHF